MPDARTPMLPSYDDTCEPTETITEMDDHTKPRICVNRPVFDQCTFDQAYGAVTEEPSTRSRLSHFLHKKLRWTPKQCRHSVVSFFPIIALLRNYKRANFVPDLIAGITVGIMHIPQGMAYAVLAGVDPVYGLYTSFFASVIYMFVGTSGHISMGTMAVASLMVGGVRQRWGAPDEEFKAYKLYLKAVAANSTLDAAAFNVTMLSKPEPIAVVTALTFLTGVILLIMGAFRLGGVCTYLSDPMISGYTTAAALMVFTAQVAPIFGLKKAPKHEGIGKLIFVYRDIILQLYDTNLYTFGIAACAIVLILLVKVCINDRFKPKVPLPIDLIVVIIATLASYFGDFKERFEVKIVENVPVGIPTPTLPDFALMTQLVPDAISLAIINFALTVSVAKIYARRHEYKIDPTQELYAYGSISVIGAFFSSWTAGASLSRSSVNESAGVKTQLGNIFAATILLIVLLWIGPLFQPLPMCVLSAVIVVALKGMFIQFADLKKLWPISKFDFSVWLFSFLATALLDVVYGLAASLLFSLLTVVIRAQRAPAKLVGRLPQTNLYRGLRDYTTVEELSQIKIFAFDSPIIFANAEVFHDQLYKALGFDLQKVRKALRASENGNAPGCGACFRFRPMKGNAIATNGDDVVLKTIVEKPEATKTLATVREDSGEFGQELESRMAAKVVIEGGTKTNGVRPYSLLEMLPHHVIIDFGGISYVDSNGAAAVEQIYWELDSINIIVFFASCRKNVLDTMEKAGVFRKINKRITFLTVGDAAAVALARPFMSSSQLSLYLTHE